MKTQKLLVILRITMLFTAAVDALFVVLTAIVLALVFGAVMLMPAWYGSVCLAAIILNGVCLCVGAVYLIFRKQ